MVANLKKIKYKKSGKTYRGYYPSKNSSTITRRRIIEKITVPRTLSEVCFFLAFWFGFFPIVFPVLLPFLLIGFIVYSIQMSLKMILFPNLRKSQKVSNQHKERNIRSEVPLPVFFNDYWKTILLDDCKCGYYSYKFVYNTKISKMICPVCGTFQEQISKKEEI